MNNLSFFDIEHSFDDFSIRLSNVPERAHMSRHFYANTNIVFFQNGECNERRSEFVLERKSADITFLYAGEAHEVAFGKRGAGYISLDLKQALFCNHNLHEHGLHKHITQIPDAKFLMLKLSAELLANDQDSFVSVQMLVLQLMSVYAALRKKNRHPKWIKTIYELLNDRWAEKITLNDLSEATRVSPITISKYFPRYFRCTVGAYLRKVKIERSLELITQTNLQLSEIAYRCNFSDQSHFNRNFRSLTAFTPGEYRQLQGRTGKFHSIQADRVHLPL